MIYVRACKYFKNKRNVWEIVGFPGGKVVKNPPAIKETWAGEDPLENEMATHSSMFCLGNIMDRGAWWITV